MKKLILAVALLACGCATSWAQDSLRIRYGNMIDADNLREHLYILAHDSLEGRETGKPGQKKAAKYIADHFSKIGVPPSVNGDYFQEFPLITEQIEKGRLVINGIELTYLEEFFFFPGFRERLIKGDAVFGGFGIESEAYSDYAEIDVTNKIVLLLDGEPYSNDGKSRITGTEKPSEWSADWRMKRDMAKAKGASAVVMLNPQYDQYIGRVKYFISNPSMKIVRQENENDGALPFFFVHPKVFDKLLGSAKLKNAEFSRKRLSEDKSVKRDRFKGENTLQVWMDSQRVSSENVLCYIRGRDPELTEELLVITAHYDHIGMDEEEIYNGADDDGSGTASLLELARVFKQAVDDGNGPRRSVLLMTVSGEEKGLLGSEWYTDHPIWPLDKTVANLNIDMIGRVDEQHANDSNYVYLIGSDRLSTELHRISEEANAQYTQLALDYTFNAEGDPNRFYYRSDHYNFAKNGIPVIFYFSGVHEDYHGANDHADKIMYGKMEKIAKLIFYTAWEIANRDRRPLVDSPN